MKPRQIGWALKSVRSETCQTKSHHSYRGDMDRITTNAFGERCKVLHSRQLQIFKRKVTAETHVANREEYLRPMRGSSGLDHLEAVEIFENDYELRYQLSEIVRQAPDDEFIAMWNHIRGTS